MNDVSDDYYLYCFSGGSGGNYYEYGSEKEIRKIILWMRLLFLRCTWHLP